MNKNAIEGMLLNTEANHHATSSRESLCRAMNANTPIEAVAVRSEGDTLVFMLGSIEGRMSAADLDYVPEGSQRRSSKPHQLVGRVLRFYVRNMVETEGKWRAILDRRTLQQEYYFAIVANWQFGDVINAKVLPGTTSKSVFVDLGMGWHSVIHQREFSHNRIFDMRQAVYPGMLLRVAVTDVDQYGMVSLSHKVLLGDFEENVEAYQIYTGNAVIGRVTGKDERGYFVALTPNLTGMIDCPDDGSELPVGCYLSVSVGSVRPLTRKIKLSFIQMLEIQPSAPAAYRYFEDENGVHHTAA